MKSLTLKEIHALRRKYLRNEDRNAHSENLQLLADNFGTEDEQLETARRVQSMRSDRREYEIPRHVQESINAYWGKHLANLPKLEKPALPVIFHKWKCDGSIIALFPTWAADTAGDFCFSYGEGLYGTSAPCPPAGLTTPATPEEYASLKAEIESTHGKLDVRRRLNLKLHQARGEDARKLRERIIANVTK